jgi:uncharacterized protein (DUF433 family)
MPPRAIPFNPVILTEARTTLSLPKGREGEWKDPATASLVMPLQGVPKMKLGQEMNSAKIYVRMNPLDWSNCRFEIDPSGLSGRPVVNGTRMPVEDIIANYEYGVSISEISTQFQIPATIINELLSYVES